MLPWGGDLRPELEAMLQALAKAVQKREARGEQRHPFFYDQRSGAFHVLHPDLPNQQLRVHWQEIEDLVHLGCLVQGPSGNALFLTAEGRRLVGERRRGPADVLLEEEAPGES